MEAGYGFWKTTLISGKGRGVILAREIWVILARVIVRADDPNLRARLTLENIEFSGQVVLGSIACVFCG